MNIQRISKNIKESSCILETSNIFPLVHVVLWNESTGYQSAVSSNVYVAVHSEKQMFAHLRSECYLYLELCK